jgi:putative FmdB family regulatory protein
MPIFGFVCDECGENFEELIFRISTIDDVSCPGCGAEKVQRQLSRVAAPASSGGSLPSFSGASCAPGGL